MSTTIDFNTQFRTALDLIDAGTSVFITGKAGTGKSTLLRHFLDTTDRRAVVVAPTGVAALNVGGQTIHRLFSFPSFVTADFPNGRDYYPGKNAKVIKTLDVLVVDEVSMVRADLIDAMDGALRRFGPHPGRSFGGVQMVFVGDPYQLPPVVLDAEAEQFRTRYATAYFFSADAFDSLGYEIVQLETVYRQRDDEFIALLNDIRTGSAGQAHFDRLNERYLPDFEPPDDEFWITLTTTNAMADSVNSRKLEQLPTDRLVHHSVVWGEINDSDKPVADVLTYKVGAQVMLLNNDSADRWVNGSIGVIIASTRTPDGVVVSIDLVDGPTVDVTAHTWEISRPVVDEGQLRYEVTGSFSQLPFKLAWAVTIHKSQGQTLSRVVVSLGRGTFADGQLYVALSRCTSLPGLVLKSQIRGHHVKVEREVARFLARSSTQTQAGDGIAYLGALATGFGRHDRIFELAAVVIDNDGTRHEFSTLLNPMRDIGRAATDFAISATSLSAAPTLAEAWPWFARRISGCVIASEGIALLQTMLERELASAGMPIDLGLGTDIRTPDAGASASALDRAGRASLGQRASGTAVASTAPYRPGTEITLPGRIHTRDTFTLTRTTGSSTDLLYADHIAHLVGHVDDSPASIGDINALAERFALSPEARRSVHDTLLNALRAAAGRDGTISADEAARISRTASALGVELTDDAPTPTDHTRIGDVLVPGTRICFTGSSVDLTGSAIEKSELKKLAEGAGMHVVEAVSKTRCDVLIAADASTMSGKAKTARDLGKPVYSTADFLTWLAQP